jgi:hypothetical protein
MPKKTPEQIVAGKHITQQAYNLLKAAALYYISRLS